MRIFVSYAKEDRESAQEVVYALSAAGFFAFLDEKDLPPGLEFNARILAAVNSADVFVFLASPYSVAPGSYALTELSFAENRWPRPHGKVLPVALAGFDPIALPAYLRPVGALRSKGNLAAEVVAWAESRATSGSSADPGLLALQEKLHQWARRAVPPEHPVPSNLPRSATQGFGGGVVALLLGLIFAIFSFNFNNHWDADNPPGSFLGPTGFPFNLFPVVGAGVVVYGIVMIAKAFQTTALSGRKDVDPQAVLVLERVSDTSVRLQTLNGTRLDLEPVSAEARHAYGGDLGWAYIADQLLLDFIPARPGDETQERPRREHG
jgi:TIR domain-containing protein